MKQEQIDSIRKRMCDNFCWFSGHPVPLEELKRACEICPLNELEVSASSWSVVRAALNELKQKEEKLYADYCDATARLKAINKIVKSDQTPRQKIEGIWPLAQQPDELLKEYPEIKEELEETTYNPRAGHLSGHLRETIMHVYDVRPSTTDRIMDMVEAIADLAKREYKRGRTDMYIELQKDKEETP